MAFEDKLITETADKRNELEAYIYAMRDKLDGALKPYGTDAERAQLSSKMGEAEDWLYGDGFDSTKQAYAKVLPHVCVCVCMCVCLCVCVHGGRLM